MDKQIFVCGVLFAIAEVFAISSLFHVDWIHSGEDAGLFTLGLTRQCQTIHGHEMMCFVPFLPPEWIASLFFLVVGVLALAATCAFVISSRWKRSVLLYAKWSCFAGIAALCFVGMLFPIGFRQTVVGGAAFRLPGAWSLGAAYNYFWVFTVMFSCVGLCLMLLPLQRVWLMN